LPVNTQSSPPRSELALALRACRSAFIGVAVFSGIINLLMLTGSFYMLEVYDRVLPSRSIPTLVGLTVLAASVFMFLGIIDLIRARVLTRIGASLDEALSARVFDAIVRLPLKAEVRNDGLQSLRDLDALRAFLSGLGPTALFDMPWLPLYISICFVFHFWLGVTATVGALILIALTLLTEMLTRAPAKAATGFAMTRNALVETSRRNAEVLMAMGMASRLCRRWRLANDKFLASQEQAADVAGGLGAIGRILRMALQSAMLGVGAFLVIQQEATGGVIIAGSILAARALAPVDLAIANWRGFVAARQSWERLTKLLSLLPAQDTPMALPAPTKLLRVEKVTAAPPGTQKIVVQDVSFTLKAGSGLGIIGSSASGKTSLARILVGVWQPARGKVSLDGAALDQWDLESLGRHIGYLPQDVELISGTVAENIARFDPDASPMKIIAAAQTAGVHELILKLASGYETDVGEQGTALSAGQQQRIALARALYGDPFLVVLDEPNSNLDADGETALTQAMTKVRARGGIVVVVAHRPSALGALDQVLVMNGGKAQAFGPKDEVLPRVLRRDAPGALKVVSENDRPNATSERSAP
jgi:PrtD family type I secretion system ABC transporter